MKKKSKFEEYRDLYLLGISNIDKVLEGRWNKALQEFNLLDDVKQQIAKDRLEICLSCPFNSINAKTSNDFSNYYLEGLNSLGENSQGLTEVHYFTNRPNKDLHCSWCACNIDEKVLSMTSNCGIEIYNKTYNQSKELKWKDITHQK